MARSASQALKRRKYSHLTLQKALSACKKGNASVCKVAKQFGIPKTTLLHKMKGVHPLNLGRPTALTESEENILEEGLVLFGEWGFPLTIEDVCDLVQQYLAVSNRRVKQFKNNRPGRDWASNFLKRHPNLTRRFCENIKRNRAQVGKEIIEEYFNNLQDSLCGVPAENIINYDETNFTDDPGSKVVIVRRGTKHAERIIDTSKSSTSVMFSVTGSGAMLAPYVVYKATHLYDTWTERGPPQTRYNRSLSGWFDMSIFEDWFFKTALPYLSKLEGKKALIGDNLASHLSMKVIQACAENNIKFLLLPPNSTHLTQPLDVSFFRPLKSAWRNELNDYKLKHRGVLPKAEFPAKLESTLDRIQATSEKNIKSGFRTCGLIPLNRLEVLKKLPNYEPPAPEDEGRIWSHVLLENLQKNRFNVQPENPKSKSKLNVKPGQSVEYHEIEKLPVKESNTSRKKQNKSSQDLPVKKSQTRKKRNKSSQDEIDLRLMEEEEDDCEEVENANEEEEDSTETDKENTLHKINDKDFVLVKVLAGSAEKHYVGQVVTDMSVDSYEVNFLRKRAGRTGLYFVFPNVPDVCNVTKWSICRKLVLIESKRGCHTFKSLDNFPSLS